jgi:hypothetical protein
VEVVVIDGAAGKEVIKVLDSLTPESTNKKNKKKKHQSETDTKNL